MKLAIISDTHFGDPNCTLFDKTADGFLPTEKYQQLLEATGRNNDYFILLGDIFDFSIAGYAGAYQAAKHFFCQIQKDNVAKEMIYIAGNHDADIWHMVEHEVNVISRIKKGKLPEPFRMAVPGLLDDRTNRTGDPFSLVGVGAAEKGLTKYGGLFLDAISQDENDPATKSVCFNFAYPNCYLVTDEETILLTHGQYFEAYWSMAGQFALKVADSDLGIGDELDIDEMIGLNFPLNQLACTGIGQAGPLKDLACLIQREKKDGKLDRIEKYLERALDQTLPTRLFKPLRRALVKFLKNWILKKMREQPTARFNQEFFDNDKIASRIKQYLSACFLEIDRINKKENRPIPRPTTLICGHTHEPITLASAALHDPFKLDDGAKLRILNSGGWLWKENSHGQNEFVGAVVFKYETGKGLESISIN